MLLLRNRGGGTAIPSLLQDAALLGAWKSNGYSGSGALLDQSPLARPMQLGSAAGADTNDPLWLPHTGTQYAYFPGVSNNSLLGRSESTLDILGDIDVRCAITTENVTSAAYLYQRVNSFHVQNSAGALAMRAIWTDGTSTVRDQTSTATIAGAATDGVLRAYRYTIDVDNGAGGADTTFYYKVLTSEATARAEMVSETGWTQLGAVVTAPTTSGFLSRGAQQAAFNTTSSERFQGKFFACQVRSGIGASGTVRLDLHAPASVSPFTTIVDTGPAAMTWDVVRTTAGRKLTMVDSPMFLTGTDDYFQTPDHADWDIGVADSYSVVWVGSLYPTVGTFGLVSHYNGAPYWMLHTTSTGIVFDINDGINRVLSNTQSFGTLGNQLIAGGVLDRGAAQLRTVVNGASSTPVSAVALLATSPSGAMTLNALNPANWFADAQFKGAAIFRRALSDSEVQKVGQELLA